MLFRSSGSSGTPHSYGSLIAQDIPQGKVRSLDLKQEEGRAAFLKLVAKADAVTENFRAGVMERLGLGYEVLREVNPRLVYGALRGFGDKRTGASPYADWPAFDVVAQAMGGIMAITGPATGILCRAVQAARCARDRIRSALSVAGRADRKSVV